MENALAILGVVRRGWRLIALAVAVCLTASAIHAARAKTTYNASARLLVIQQGGRPLSVAGGDPFQHAQGQDSLATHLLIIRSPVIVERAIGLIGMDRLKVGSVIDRLTVKQTIEGAKVLELGYQADTGDEALAVMKGVVASYDQFLKDNYQKDTREVINLIVKARDDLSKELRQLEREYLEFRQKSPTLLSDKDGRTFLSRRVDQWDQASNQAMARAMQVKTQLELAKKLAGEGAAHNFIASAINQLAGGGSSGIPLDAPREDGTDISYERCLSLLADVRSQRRNAERMLQQLRINYASSQVTTIDDPEIVRAFYADPGVADLKARIQEEKRLKEASARISRQNDDPSVRRHADRIKAMEAQIATLWREMGPELLTARQDLSQVSTVRRAEEELIVLKAREATLDEQAKELKAERAARLRAEREGLARRASPPVERIADLDSQIAKLEGPEDADTIGEGDRRNSNLIGTLERSAEAIDAMRGQIKKLFDEDLDESKKAEIAQLAEANLRNNLDRQRTLFDSVASQLKQAQMASDFGSVSAKPINPPSVVPIRPKVTSVLMLGLFVGCGLGGGLAYLIDLLEGRIRTISELKAIIDLPILAMIPRFLGGPPPGASHVALLSHQDPRSFLAESYKTARTNLEFLRRNRQAQVILVSSPNPGDGKSTTSSNLAITMALAGRKVLLVDGDLRKPCLHEIYGLNCATGLASILQGEASFAQAVQETSVNKLDLLAAGPAPSNPAELLASDLLGRLLDEIRPNYDVIIFDTSPFLAVTDPWIVSAVADGILLVVRLGSTRRHDIDQTMDVLKTLDAPILGMIANGVVRENLGYRSHYGYGPSYGQAPKQQRLGAGEVLEESGSIAVEIEGIERDHDGRFDNQPSRRWRS